ncbi:MAG: hypothetical protein RR873_03795, partial [Christensenella sp.]
YPPLQGRVVAENLGVLRSAERPPLQRLLWWSAEVKGWGIAERRGFKVGGASAPTKNGTGARARLCEQMSAPEFVLMSFHLYIVRMLDMLCRCE